MKSNPLDPLDDSTVPSATAFDGWPVPESLTPYAEIARQHKISATVARRITQRSLDKLYATFHEIAHMSPAQTRAFFNVSAGDEARFLAIVVERLVQFHGPRTLARSINEIPVTHVTRNNSRNGNGSDE